MSDTVKTLLIAAFVAAFAGIMFFGGNVYGYNKARDDLMLTCILTQQAIPVAMAVHVCSALQGNQ